MKNFGYKEVGLKWAKKTPEVPRLTLTDKIYSKDRVQTEIRTFSQSTQPITPDVLPSHIISRIPDQVQQKKKHDSKNPVFLESTYIYSDEFVLKIKQS